MKKILTKLVTTAILTIAGCDSGSAPSVPDGAIKYGQLQSGMRYSTYLINNGRDRVISFCDGTQVESFEHSGDGKRAGDFLQIYDIRQDGKYVLIDEQFKAKTIGFGSNAPYWSENAIGNSQLRLEAINNANEALQQLGIDRVLEEGSPDIHTAKKRKANSLK